MNIRVIRSARRTISIEITPDCDVILRAPYLISRGEIERFIDSRTDWINKTVRKMQKEKALREKAEATKARPLNDEETAELVKAAKAVIPSRVAYFSDILGTEYGRITIRNQKTRWGSCSSKHNLNFNCYLMNAPEEILDYVVVHELCHLKEMNHSKEFWAHVESIIPDYKKRKKWLKDYGEILYTVDAPNVPPYK